MSIRPPYTEYHEMDLEPNILSKLDKYADDMVADYYLKIESDNREIKSKLKFLFDDILKINYRLWTISRELFKFGNYYMKFSLSPQIGIFKAIELPVFNVTVEEKHDFIKHYIIDGEKYENYEVAHFKLIKSGDFLPYGESILKSSVRMYKQLQLLEDAILIKRIIKKEKIKADEISDVEYMMNKLIASMGMQSTEQSESLSDIRYKRKLDVVRKAISSELQRIATVHLYTINEKQTDLTNFRLTLEQKEK